MVIYIYIYIMHIICCDIEIWHSMKLTFHEDMLCFLSNINSAKRQHIQLLVGQNLSQNRNSND